MVASHVADTFTNSPIFRLRLVVLVISVPSAQKLTLKLLAALIPMLVTMALMFTISPTTITVSVPLISVPFAVIRISETVRSAPLSINVLVSSLFDSSDSRIRSSGSMIAVMSCSPAGVAFHLTVTFFISPASNDSICTSSTHPIYSYRSMLKPHLHSE